MTPRAIALQAHIDALCKHHRIGVHYKPGRRAYAWQIERRIQTQPVVSDNTYAVALHEIGHILGKWQTRGVMLGEVGAWRWAKSNALVWTPAMNRKMRDCVETYVANATVDDEIVPVEKLWHLIERTPNV